MFFCFCFLFIARVMCSCLSTFLPLVLCHICNAWQLIRWKPIWKGEGKKIEGERRKYILWMSLSISHLCHKKKESHSKRAKSQNFKPNWIYACECVFLWRNVCLAHESRHSYDANVLIKDYYVIFFLNVIPFRFSIEIIAWFSFSGFVFSPFLFALPAFDANKITADTFHCKLAEERREEGEGRKRAIKSFLVVIFYN